MFASGSIQSSTMEITSKGSPSPSMEGRLVQKKLTVNPVAKSSGENVQGHSPSSGGTLLSLGQKINDSDHSSPIMSLSHILLMANDKQDENLGNVFMPPGRMSGIRGTGSGRLSLLDTFLVQGGGRGERPSSPSSFSNSNASKEDFVDYVLEMLMDDQQRRATRKRSLYERNDLSGFQNDLLRDGENHRVPDNTGSQDGHILEFQWHGDDDDDDDLSVLSFELDYVHQTRTKNHEGTLRSLPPEAPLVSAPSSSSSSCSDSVRTFEEDFVDYVVALAMDDNQERERGGGSPSRKRSLYKRVDLTAFQNDLLRDSYDDIPHYEDSSNSHFPHPYRMDGGGGRGGGRTVEYQRRRRQLPERVEKDDGSTTMSWEYGEGQPPEFE